MANDDADDVIDRAAGTALVKCDVIASDVRPCDVIAGADDVYSGLRLREVAPLWLKYPESAGKGSVIPFLTFHHQDRSGFFRIFLDFEQDFYLIIFTATVYYNRTHQDRRISRTFMLELELHCNRSQSAL